MLLDIPAELDEEVARRRQEAADRIRVARDVNLPPLIYWNDRPCAEHQAWVDEDGIHGEEGAIVEGLPFPACLDCGAIFRRHQRVGLAWLYFVRQGLLADPVGTGKTIHAAGLLALLKQNDEIGHDQRALIVMRPVAIPQWQNELARLVPALDVMSADGTRKQRIDRYLQPWETCLIGFQMLQRDFEVLRNFPISTLILDDIDALRNPENLTAYYVKQLAARATRVVVMTGTPLQKKLHELHSVLETIGGNDVFGSQAAFMRRYVRTEMQTFYDRGKGRSRTAMVVVGYKNLDEFKVKIAPLSLRRTVEDIDDVTLPTIISSDVALELYPAQRVLYNQLKKNVKELLAKDGKNITTLTAMGKIHLGAKICSGLAAIGQEDKPGTAIKLDWLMEHLDGDLDGEKVVIFINYKDTIRAFTKRLIAAKIGHEIIWGENRDRAVRQASQERFWKDPNCRVLVGTTSIEQSLNLQVARHLINVDTILNPARMTQLAGRIRRDGSAFKHVYVHNLRCSHTQEDGYADLLAKEQAVIDYVWSEDSEMFEKLSPTALLALIAA